MNIPEIKKAKALIISKIIEYVSHSVVSRNIIIKNTGSISVVAIDIGEKIIRKISPFDIFIEIIKGTAEFVIENNSIILNAGQAIIIPAHAANSITAIVKSKILVTIIKSGYEQDI